MGINYYTSGVSLRLQTSRKFQKEGLNSIIENFFSVFFHALFFDLFSIPVLGKYHRLVNKNSILVTKKQHFANLSTSNLLPSFGTKITNTNTQFV
jgi:hypothetical protein